MTDKLLKYDVAIKATKKVWQMDIPECYTSDENTATFNFNITDLEEADLVNVIPNVYLYMRDGSFFQNGPVDGVDITGTKINYTMKGNEGKHSGIAKAQLILIWENGVDPIKKLTSQLYEFKVVNGLETKVAVEVMIQDWTTLTAEAQVYLDQMAAKHAIADADHTRAETDHTTATSDHTTALADHAVTADMITNGTNLVTNGDFSNGTTGWAANFADLSVVNGEMIVTLTENNASSGIHRFNTDIPAGNKFYASADIFTTYAGAVKIGFLNNVDTKSVPAGQYNKISALRSMGEYNIFTIYHDTTGAYVIGDTFKIKNALLIDLTATFGKGNEPTVEQMDEIMSKFPNSWFDGTKNLFRASETLKKQIAIDTRTEFDAKNLIVNGDFSNGTIGWESAGFGTLSANSGILSVTSIDADWTLAVQINKFFKLGSKVYARASVKNATGGVTFALCNNLSGDPIKIVTGASADTWYTLSGIFEGTGINQGIRVHKNGTTSIGDVMQVKNVLLIDLTATFGAGKEPTLAEIDRLMARYPNSWFDGTKPIQTIETLYQEKANKTQEGWITPTLLNGWTEVSGYPVKYMKDNMGFVHLKGALKGGTGEAFVLPLGYRPSDALRCAITTTQFAHETATLTSTGYLYANGYIDNITFRAEG